MRKYRAARISGIEVAVRISHGDNAIGNIITSVIASTSPSLIEWGHTPRHLTQHAKLHTAIRHLMARWRSRYPISVKPNFNARAVANDTGAGRFSHGNPRLDFLRFGTGAWLDPRGSDKNGYPKWHDKSLRSRVIVEQSHVLEDKDKDTRKIIPNRRT